MDSDFVFQVMERRSNLMMISILYTPNILVCFLLNFVTFTTGNLSVVYTRYWVQSNQLQ